MSGKDNTVVTFKYLLVGDSGVGKSSLMHRFADDTYSDEYRSTVGTDFKCRHLKMGKDDVKVQIWDTAGQERFRSITTSYYRGANAVLVVFDVTDLASFNNVSNWSGEVSRHADEKCHRILVGNKCDLIAKRVVTFEQANEFAKSVNMVYREVSCKSSEQVNECFIELAAELLLAQQAEQSRKNKGEGAFRLSSPGNMRARKRACC